MLSALLRTAFDNFYFRELCDHLLGHHGVSTLALLSHLYSSFRQIIEEALQKADIATKDPYHPETPFSTFMDRIKTAIELHNTGTPYSESQIISN